MSEKSILSRLSVFILGAGTFLAGAYHSYPFHLFRLTFILCIVFSLISGILLRKNESRFIYKVTLFSSTSIVLFPVFNYIAYEIKFDFFFIYPLSVILLFIAGLSVNFKSNPRKSSILFFSSIIFICMSYVLFPVFMFQINFTKKNQQIKNFELINDSGNTINDSIFNNKISVILYTKRKCSMNKCKLLYEISEIFKDNNEVNVINIVYDSESNFFFNQNDTSNFYSLTDFENKLSGQLKMDVFPSFIIIDKDKNVRYIHKVNYNCTGNFLKKQLLMQINLLKNEKKDFPSFNNLESL